MLSVIRDSWTLLLGLLLLMLGNGLQGTLLGVRGASEGMTPGALSIVMSAYFVGMLTGARVIPGLVRRVGHVRVLAALASLISAGFIVYPAAPHPVAWAAVRLVVGFCFCGVYIVAESWLNDRADNRTRGQAMSAYMMTQMIGIIAAQGLLNFADPDGWALFALMSILVSVSVTPMLLSAGPAPAFETTAPMSLRRLFAASPLGCVATFLLGGVFAAMFGMGAVYGALRGYDVAAISGLVAAMYVGGALSQWPIGWLSDRMDRRRLIVALCLVGAAAGAAAAALDPGYALTLILAGVIGGVANPLYGIIIAHTNDFLHPRDMPAASGGLLFLNGTGAVGGPVVVGLLMDRFGPIAYFLYFTALLALIAGYGLWRMTRRRAPDPALTGAAPRVLPSATPVAVEIATGLAAEGRDRAS